MGDRGVRVGDQREPYGPDLVGEGSLRVEGVGGATGDPQTEPLETVEPCLELEDLVRSAGRVGLEVEEEDERSGLEGVR